MRVFDSSHLSRLQNAPTTLYIRLSGAGLGGCNSLHKETFLLVVHVAESVVVLRLVVNIISYHCCSI